MKNIDLLDLFKTRFPVDEVIGSGVDGIVISSKGFAVKASLWEVEKYKTIINFLYSKPYEYVCVHEYGNLTEEVAYCVMDKLNPLSDDEYKMFFSLISHEDRNIMKDLSGSKFNETLDGLSKGFEFDRKQVVKFCNLLFTSHYKHLDLHPRNIMKNKNKEFKLIDLDRIRYVKN